jgi:Putative Flp pilus-assembly TadE/G-like
MKTAISSSRRHGELGSILVMTALTLPVLLGIAALALDAGYLFDYRQRMGAAADAAAVAGAFEIKRSPGISQGSLEGYARGDATRNGFTHGSDGITVTVIRGDFDGTNFTPGNTSDDKFVKVVVSRPTPTFLMGLFGRTTMVVTTQAIAGPGSQGLGCIYALNQADPKYTTELDISASGVTINTPNCGVVSNGNFAIVSGSTITASETDVSAASGSVAGTVNGPLNYGVPASDDPFLDMDQATLFGTSWTCDYTNYLINAGTVPYTHTPMVFCGNSGNAAIKIGGSVSVPVTFPAGVYIINGGGIDWKHTLIEGTGVTFYFTASGSQTYKTCGNKIFDSDPPDTFNLTAPTTGPYQGLLFIQDQKQGTLAGTPSQDCSSNPIKVLIKPSDMDIDGVIYFPNHHIDYGATTTSSGAYTILVGGTLAFPALATLNSDFTSLGGVSPVKRTGIAQ